MSKPKFYFDVPWSLFKVLQYLQKSGYRVVIVGGAVRDYFLNNLNKMEHDNQDQDIGYIQNDYDLASDAPPDKIQKLFPSRCLPTGIRHGTVTILEGGDSYEITTFRKDGIYKDGRHPEQVTLIGELSTDLARRDFTINALAFEPDDFSSLFCKKEKNQSIRLQGRLHDLHGGLDSLQQAQIRAIGQPKERFQEDALRMLRACRFSAKLGFSIEPQTLEAIQTLAPSLKKVSQPRIKDELCKLLCAPFAPQGLKYLSKSRLWPQVMPNLPDDSRSLDLFSYIWQCWQSNDNFSVVLLQIANQLAEGHNLRANRFLHWDKEKVPLFSFLWAILCLSTFEQLSSQHLEHYENLIQERIEDLFQGINKPNIAENKSSEKNKIINNRFGGLEELGVPNREKNAALRLIEYYPLIWGPVLFRLLYSGSPKYSVPAVIRCVLVLIDKDFWLPAFSIMGLSAQVCGVSKDIWFRFCNDLRNVLIVFPPLNVKELAVNGNILSQEGGIPFGPQIGAVLYKLLGHVLQYPQDNKLQTLLTISRKYSLKKEI